MNAAVPTFVAVACAGFQAAPMPVPVVWYRSPANEPVGVSISVATYQNSVVDGAGPCTKKVAKRVSWFWTRFTPHPLCALPPHQMSEKS